MPSTRLKWQMLVSLHDAVPILGASVPNAALWRTTTLRERSQVPSGAQGTQAILCLS